MIGSLLWLVRDAANQAIIDGTEKITRKSLDVIAVDMTAAAALAGAGGQGLWVGTVACVRRRVPLG